jgi:hypothetical protein
VKPSTTVVITVEGLSTSALSCYGSSWNETPHFDAFTAAGCVWDNVIATSTDPFAVLASWVENGTESWVAEARRQGSLELFTDDARFVRLQCLSVFDRVELVEEKTFRTRQRPRDHVDQTRAGRLFAAALDRMDQDDRPRVLWIHSSSLTKCWDAPRYLALVDPDEEEDTEPSEDVELIQMTSDEGERQPPPPSVFDSLEPPGFLLPPDCHPDLAMSWMRTYGCQVRLLDLLVGLVRNFEQLAGADMMIAGTSGFPLGENGWIGVNSPTIRSSLLRLPLLISQPNSLRVPQLTSSDEVQILLRKLIKKSSPLVSREQWALRQSEIEPRIETANVHNARLTTTPRWFFVEESTRDRFLYLKPDDTGDVNDISRLRDDVVELLSGQAHEADSIDKASR